MTQSKNKTRKFFGFMLFLLAAFFFCLQMGYLLFHSRFQVEYIHNGLFYIINILIAVSLALAVLLLFTLPKKTKVISAVGISVFLLANIALLITEGSKVKHIVSISPDSHVLLIKENEKTGQAVYYRIYFSFLARAKETLPQEIAGNYKVKWLENDIAAITYKDADNRIQQFIGTYGDRGDGGSYYNIGPSIQGNWKGEKIKVISKPDGIMVIQNNEVQTFDWEHTKQFGTLAIVLMEDGQAAWTISLKESFNADQNVPRSKSEQISLYKATTDENEPVTLQYSM
ncbi:hypothetical protein [Mesobacillus zeae]|uniref:Uncharacterized protein n=1 Tax=Mesobacillus zeae TaxID=1917180 RepID=A0A398B8E2_9BACI|nr:hypothetical protein [Mesobacillus zeae]RID85754.1 hypothetical protein D1970_09435 [Mesobacillus zeae]